MTSIIEAAVMRLRPILMTTGAMVLGAVPLAIATGAGAQSRQAIGWVIVGGMSFGTLLTLFVVPIAYSLITRDKPTASTASISLGQDPSCGASRDCPPLDRVSRWVVLSLDCHGACITLSIEPKAFRSVGN